MPIKVSYHSVKFGCHRLSGSGDIMVLLCHVTFQDHVIKALNDLMVRMETAEDMSPSIQIW